MEKIKTWVLTEGIAGTENQCLGVAEALGLTPEIKRIQLRQPWKLLSPYLKFETARTFIPSLNGPWPDLLIASGRKSIAASRFIKRASNGKTYTVQIQDPRISNIEFDLVAVPAHDPTRGDNVIVTTAAPNRITQARLHAAKHECAATLENLSGQKLAVMIGGNSAAYQLTPEITRTLCEQLKTLSHQGYALMITTSRRTGEENTALLKKELENLPNLYFWNGKTPNPYFGFLAWADYILVTADSVSMLSEAATTGKPVYMLPLISNPKKTNKRLNLYHENMKNGGYIKIFDGSLQPFSYAPLGDSQKIADEIRKRSGLFA